MSDPFIGEIKIWAFAWAPRGWALCNGATMQISQNQALYSLIGAQFGGSPPTTFNLPDLRGRTPIGTGRSPEDLTTVYSQGTSAGAEAVALVAANVPGHMHTVSARSTNGTQTFVETSAGTGYFASVVPSNPAQSPPAFNVYLPNPNAAIPSPQALSAGAVSPSGGGAPHNNMQPYLVLNFCICTSGIYPPRP